MRLKKIVIINTIILSAFILSGCTLANNKEQSSGSGLNSTGAKTADIIYDETKKEMSSEITKNFDADKEGPWENSIYISYSDDGRNFTGEKVFVHRAGVPHLLVTDDNRLIASFQYFSPNDPELFDSIMYSLSNDGGQTWTEATSLKLSGFPGGPTPADPLLVELDDGRIRFYFTFETPSDGGPQTYSAIANDINDVFEFEGRQIYSEDGLYDPVVVKFKDTWHHFTVLHDKPENGLSKNFHSTSSTGTDFVRQENLITSIQMLGDAIVSDDMIVFYGSNSKVISTITSKDGYGWENGFETGIDGADPGVAKLSNGKYVMIYTYLQ